jgi:thiamine phosphate synthase YjbQ (UPF0047 family)
MWPFIAAIFATIAVIEFALLLGAWQRIFRLEERIEHLRTLVRWHEGE